MAVVSTLRHRLSRVRDDRWLFDSDNRRRKTRVSGATLRCLTVARTSRKPSADHHRTIKRERDSPRIRLVHGKRLQL